MNKRVILIIIGVIVAVAGFLLLTEPPQTETAEASNHTVGNSTTGVTLVEYGDFQCPACASYHPSLKEVKEKYKDHITFQFRHFPLEAIHKNARAGSRAAEAAGLQGMFWEMHDYLYENQSAWQGSNDPLTVFEGYARSIGIPDIEKFKTDMRGAAVNAVITADLNTGRDLGATATPTFILDGKLLEENPAPTLDSFSAIIDEAIRSKGGTPPSSAAGIEPAQE